MHSGLVATKAYAVAAYTISGRPTRLSMYGSAKGGLYYMHAPIKRMQVGFKAHGRTTPMFSFDGKQFAARVVGCHDSKFTHVSCLA